MLSGPGNAPSGAPDVAGGGAPRCGDPTSWARGIGALQEAERVGSWRVGSEHLLAASLLDPVARRVVLEAGVDLGVVQAQIGRPVHAGIGARPGLLPRPEDMSLSDGATQALERLRARIGDDPSLATWVRPDRSTDPRGRSVVRRRLLVLLLEGEGPGGAWRVLDRLGVAPHTERLVARLGEPDPSSPL
ncbi:Clp protease N-terminal domain-containing protein [Actinomycetospora straminea]|uniref:Clp protease N-terminal domain-containing protein n=1 Tax=Actinomycetospora straminea TaxID=663607 RepID=UPI002365A334|nr:Clp protease N-terminal domain-containing protein [Actinomycetospora straminea]MDD7932719.1 Clp protease N-terminal domain-containing protein [Actinomycetospora straminea]